MKIYIIRRNKTIQSVNTTAKTKKGMYHYEDIEEQFIYTTEEKAAGELGTLYREAQRWADVCNEFEDKEQEKYNNYSVNFSLVEYTDEHIQGELTYKRHIAFANATASPCINGIRWEK